MPDQTDQNLQSENLKNQSNQESNQKPSSDRGANQGRSKMTRRQFLRFTVTGAGLILAGYFYRMPLAGLLDELVFPPEKLVKVELSELIEFILALVPSAVDSPIDGIPKNFAKNFADPNEVRKIEEFKLFANPFWLGEYILLNLSEIFSGALLEKPSNSQPLELHLDLPKKKVHPVQIQTVLK